jgi:hypothetical protein
MYIQSRRMVSGRTILFLVAAMHDLHGGPPGRPIQP